MAANQLASVFVKIGAETKEFEKGLHDAKQKMGSLEKGGAALGTALKAGIGIGVAAIGALTAAIGVSVKAAADMEQQVADIRSIFGSTAPKVEELNDLIMDLGLDPKLKVSATEAASAIEMLGKNGLTMSEITAGAAKNTVLLANATGNNFALAADIATDVMSQFNINANDMSTAVDGIVGVTVASKFSIDDYALAIAQAGGVASSVGVDFNDFNAVIAATSPSFASGSDAGTSFKTFLQRLVPQTDKAKSALMDLGLSAGEDVVTAFFDANGAMRPMEEIAENLQNAFAGLSEAQKIEAASTIFGTDAMRTALALAEGGGDIIQAMKDVIGNTSAEEAAATRMDTFAGAMEIAQGIIETLSISVGQKFLPVLRPLVEQFNTLAETYGPKVVDFFGTLAERLQQGIEKGIEWGQRVLPPLWEKLQQVGSVVQLLAGQIQQALRPVTDAIAKYMSWKDVLAALGILLLGPVVAALAAVVAAIGAVLLPVAKITLAIVALRTAWEKDFLGIRTITLDVLDRIATWIKTYTGWWQGSWTKTLDFMLRHSGDVWSHMVGELKIWWGRMTNEIRHQLAVMGENVQNWVDVVRTKFKVWKNNTLGQFREWKDGVLRFFEPVLEWWDEHIAPFAQKGRQVIQGLWDGIREKWNSLRDWFTGVWGDLTDRFKRFFGIASPSKLFEGYGQNMMQGLELGIKDGITYVKQTLEDGSQVWEDVVTKSWVPVFSEAGQQISGALDATIPKLENYQKKLLDAKIAALELASKPILPDWATGEQPVLVHPPAVNTGDGGSSGGGPVTSAPVNNKYYKSLGSTLDALFGGIGVNVASSINTFAYLAKQAITAPGQTQWQGSSASYMGYNVIDEANVSEAGTGAVIGAIQALINELRNRSIKIDTAQMEALIDALKSGNPNAYSDLVGFMAGGR